MRSAQRFLLPPLAVLTAALALFGAKRAANPQMDEHKRARHALNRLTFGPRPGEAELVEKMGVDKWIELQLHPDRIDDSHLDARLAPLRTLKMSTAEVMENFPPPQVLKAVAEGRQPMPSDPARRAIYESAIAQYEARKQRAAATANGNNSGAPELAGSNVATQANKPNDGSLEARMYAQLDAANILDLPPEQRYAAIMKMPPEERAAMGRTLNGSSGDLLDQLTPQQRETVEALGNPQRVVVEETAEGKLLRAIYSERQLQEVMTDFWFNHFNVFIGKGPERYLVESYERDVIRPRALGKFKDLLLATAQSPAMLFYLDNWQSVGPDSPAATGIARPQDRSPFRVDPFGRIRARRTRPHPQANANAKNQRRGLNENYAREIMELHTLGVDGGYTQRDVTELAKILTGWTIAQPRKGGGFEFNQRMHQPGTKIFLGKTFHEDGENEGLKALAMLARSPATARFVSKKLAMRFVADDPPPALVDRMSQTFLKSDGDIREVLRTMFRSPEFWSADDYRAKIKTPLEFVSSAVRCTGADVTNALPLVAALNRMGMPLYGMQPPTGYPMKASSWVNSAALVNRMNFALALGNGRVKGSQPDEQILLGANPPQQADAALGLLEQDLLNGDVSAQTHTVLEKQLSDPLITGRKLDDPARPPNYGVLIGLIVGSPEFQRR